MAAPRRSRTSADPVFVDTGFWTAFLLLRDQHRPRALRWSAWVDRHSIPLCTTEAVLWELVNGLSKPSQRATAAAVYRRCHEGSRVEVVGFDTKYMRSAFALFEARPDKAWSLTDCFSFVVMEGRGLKMALTPDHHYEQAGFRALLLEEPPD